MTRDQAKDAGMALCLLSLLAGLLLDLRWLQWLATSVLVIDMTAPSLFRPFAVFWFWLAAAIGAVTSRIVFATLFIMVVTPVGVVRRWLGHDAMRMRRWKNGSGSVFTTRDHLYSADDIKDPY